METIRKILKLGLVPILMAFIITTIVPGFKTEARAGSGAAFLGGMVAGHVIGGAVRRSRIRTAAAVHTAYDQPRTQPVYVQAQPTETTYAQPAPTAEMTPEQKLQQLDKLAAGGYITPEEYKAKKKAILDSM
jgi:hypothetical protein